MSNISFHGGEPMTDRELEVLMLICEGYKAREIAAELFITYHTVRTHERHIREKLYARSMAQAVAKAYHLGYLVPRVTNAA